MPWRDLKSVDGALGVAFVAACALVALHAAQPPAPPQKPVVVNDDTQHHIGNLDKPSAELQQLALARPGTAAPILTRSVDNLRSGANTAETILTLARVRQGMRPIFKIALGGDARGFEAQPLIAPSVVASDGTTHDMLLLATMGNIVGSYDAQDGTPLWVRRLGPPVRGSKQIDHWVVNEYWGILSTGVVDNVFYVVAWISPDGTPQRAVHRLYALRLRDGTDARPPLQLPGGPSTIQRKQRASLTLATVGGRPTLFIPWGTVQETQVGAHGFITAVDVGDWKVSAELNLTPTGFGAGIWQAGQGLVADAEGFLFAMTSNGTYDGKVNFGESFIKVRYDGSTMTVIDHYSPFRDDQRTGAYADQDLGSGGPSLIPELQLVFGAGKDGILYMLPWRQLHKPTIPPIWYTFYPGPNIPATKVYDQLFFNRTHHAHSSSVVWKTGNQWRAFCWGENGNLRAWAMTKEGAKFLANGAEVASVQSPVPPGGMPGGFLALSANGQQEGILWATVPLGDANRTVTQGYLAAYDATTFGKYPDGTGAIALLWKSEPFTFSKFLPPVVSGGMVYVATYAGEVLAFGP